MNNEQKYVIRTLRSEAEKINFSSHSAICSQLASSAVSLPEWRPNLLTSEMSVALISLTIVNLLVSPLMIFVNVLVILAVKTTPQLRDKYNVLLAGMAGTDIMTGALAQPLFIAEVIYRLTGSPASEFCIIPHATRGLTGTFGLISLDHLALISMERYISIKLPFKYHDIVTKRRLIVCDVLASSLVFTALFFRFKVVLFRYFLIRFAIYLPIFILIFCRIASYHEARKRIGKIPTQSARAKFLKQKKALKTTSFVIGLVFLFYVPMPFLRAVFAPFISSPETFLVLESFMLTLALCNSVCNPVIYCARCRQYRQAFRKLLHITNNVQTL